MSMSEGERKKRTKDKGAGRVDIMVKKLGGLPRGKWSEEVVLTYLQELEGISPRGARWGGVSDVKIYREEENRKNMKPRR